MEADGFALPVIEAHCDYRQPARYDDELEVRTTGALLSPVRVRVRLRGRARRPTTRVLADGHTVHAVARPRRAGPCRLPDRVREAAST